MKEKKDPNAPLAELRVTVYPNPQYGKDARRTAVCVNGNGAELFRAYSTALLHLAGLVNVPLDMVVSLVCTVAQELAEGESITYDLSGFRKCMDRGDENG